MNKITRPMSAVAVLLLAVLAISPARAQTSVYTLDGGIASETDQTYAATGVDQSAVYVLNSGHLTLTNCTMTKTGEASNVNNSSQYGINAGVLAASASTVKILGGSVTTNASGGNGLFATGSGSSIEMSNGVISAAGVGAHGVDATYGGSITLTDVDVTTDGSNASALATDFGGGTVTVTGGTIVSANTGAGGHSAGIYSTGEISVTDATVASYGDCGGVIDGANSISLTNTDLSGAIHGVKTWKTAPANGSATVTIDGGSLTAEGGDAFYVTAETGNAATATLTVKGGATISTSTGNLVKVLGSSTATVKLDGVDLAGRLRADNATTSTVSLENGTILTGAVSRFGMTLDAGSVWHVTSNSILTSLVDPDGVSGLTITNIVGNGHDVHYDSTLPDNTYLGGHTYALVNGGTLTPEVVPTLETSWGAVKAMFGGQ
jgi:hypothetical protein